MTLALPTAIAELRRWPQWVIWRLDAREGKTTKIPLNPKAPGQRASSTDPKTWAPYEATLKPIEKGRADGAGFVFTATDEYAGIDLDHCVTDGAVHPKALEIVRRLDSYTEFSPSGTGLHILVRAAVNGKRNRTKNTPWEHDFEVYDRARFFTVTGRQLFGSPATIESRQKELDAVIAELFPVPSANSNGHAKTIAAASVAMDMDDVALEEKIRASKQGAKYAELFDRGAPEDRESESDLALCNILAFWLGPDPARIDAWFRRSALMRDKWDDKRGDTTYGGYTIDRALEDRTEFYGRKKTAPPASPRPEDDNTEMSYAEEISSIFGLIDDPIVQGRRWGRKATAHVVFTTKSGAELDLDSWKTATTKPATLAQEIGVQLGVETTLEAKDIRRLNVLVGKFCELCVVTTIADRARDLGMAFLRDAVSLPVDMKNTEERWAAIKRIKDTDPASIARANGKSIAASSLVLAGKDGRRYVKVQWFIDFVKAAALGSMSTTIIERIEEVGWARPNSQGKVKFTNPAAGDQPAYLFEVFYEVPEGWETKDGTGAEVT